MLQSDSKMLTTVITGLVIFTVGQASPPLLVAQVSDVSVPNVTSVRLTTQDVLPTTPGFYASSVEDSVSLNEANHADVIPVVPLSSDGISSEEPAWVTTDPPRLGESAVNFSTDVPDLNFGTRSPFISEDISTTWDPDITTDVVTTVSDETRDTMTKEAVEGVRKRGTVVNCFCDADEVYVDGVCHPYPEGTVVHMRKEKNNPRIVLRPMAERQVIIKDLECDTENGVMMLNFSRGQFRLRDRGDIVLSEEAGEYAGLRIELTALITHWMNIENSPDRKGLRGPAKYTTMLPTGQAMKDNVCRRWIKLYADFSFTAKLPKAMDSNSMPTHQANTGAYNGAPPPKTQEGTEIGPPTQGSKPTRLPEVEECCGSKVGADYALYCFLHVTSRSKY
ncbi:uncharacterized protein LOC119568961 [Penaeus monodon]|uniref:uncharacterized protein LOC119568961 n=1 Tax=Penaeus monodon TaxID=6687 RepID=UPI0018A7CACF|nr:uncharacterized protein LOC119568961 [Penaeus monodon]